MASPFPLRSRLIAGALTAALLAVLPEAPTLAAPGGRGGPPTPKTIPAVATTAVAATPPAEARPVPDATARPGPSWPAPATVEVALPSVPQSRLFAGDTGGTGQAGTLPIWVSRPTSSTAPDRVRVQVLDRATTTAAGITGLLLRVTQTEPAGLRHVDLTVGYRGFRTAYGADWATRLRLAAVPDCVLSTPQRPQCAARPLTSRNDWTRATVTGTVPVEAGTLIALDAGSSGQLGDYTATSLQASSGWSAGGNSGDFTWSYPMRVPPSVGGPTPQVGLSYSAQSVDGRHPATNNQPSAVGEGFDLSAGGYIERRYRPCNNDKAPGANNSTDVGDECWATDNATLSLTGHSGELLYNAAEGGWHLRSDDGSRIQRRTGAANGDNDGEHWVVTTSDGIQYWFGLGRLPGWTAGRPETKATWTAPVFGNHPGEPCHATAFANSSCTQAWRWNLDYVVDTHGNTMSLWYATETNKYARNMATSAPVDYIRAGWLDHIDYGTDQRTVDGAGNPVDSVFAGSAPARVVIGHADRCLSDCTVHDGTHWPDTPWDRQCTGSPCNVVSPTFWTTRRLSTITTRVWDATVTPPAHRDVERWTLTHTFPDPGDANKGGLWLDRLSHVGLAGGQTTTVPDIEFTPVSLNNRVDGIDFASAMNWFRIARIRTETGATISVTYSDPDCTAAGPKPAPESNARRCYPVIWKPEGFTNPVTDWFHKYVVTAIYEADNTGGVPPRGSPRVVYQYSYLGNPAWHYTDDDGLIDPAYKTWSDWRGYATVGVTVGDPGEQTYTQTRYFRGMHGDRLPAGTRTIVIDGINDENWWAGATREKITHNGPGGPEVSAATYDPWASAPTASRTINGDTVTARFTNTAVVITRTTLDGGRPARRTRTSTTFDAHGMAVQVDDDGDLAVTDDQRCAKTVYEPRNTTRWLTAFPHRVQSFAVSCAAASDPATLTDADVISDTKTSYDGQTWSLAPARGKVTLTEQVKAWNGGASVYITAAGAGYDAQGRIVDTWDALNRHTLTGYTPATGGPLTARTVTNAKNHVATTHLDPAWGTPLAVVDANGKRTDLGYDGLGRLTGVWLPGRAKGSDTAHATYGYLIRNTAPSVVTTGRLHPSGLRYVTSYSLYDGMLRNRQTQAPAPTLTGSINSRIVTDTFYDTAGRVSRSYGGYPDDNGPPGETLVGPDDPTEVPNQTRTVYDGAGRVSQAIFQPYAVERWRTSTGYGGDRTDVTPPPGGTATSVVADARGATVELRQYQTPTPTGAYHATRYGYNRKGQLATVTDPAGNHWDYGYDLLGRQVSATDPDKGTTTSGYDDAGQLTSTIDARTVKLVYTYDKLGRRTGLWLNQVAGTARAQWFYDTLAKGHLDEARRNVGLNAYRQVVNGYNDAYQPTSQSIIVPSAETGLAGTYTYTFGYMADGNPATTGIPQTGDLAAEALTHHYDQALPLPIWLTTVYGTSSDASYVSGTHYNQLAQLDQITLHTGKYSGTGSKVWLSNAREPETGRLTQLTTTRETGTPTTLSDLHYSYDPAGNITKIADSAAGDSQCFRTDHLHRLTEAWTPATGDCAPEPTAAGLGGPAPYWQTWTYDTTGNRLTQVDHATPAGQASTSYTVPPAGSPRPHTVTGTSTTDNTGTRTAAYSYDTAGNTRTRPTTTAGTQTLTWDPEGHLSTSVDTTGTTSYVYDAGGNRLIRRDPTGRTLYLPGQELRYTAATGKTCTRYYSYAGAAVASRTAAGLTWLANDQQGTAQTAINEATQHPTIRRQTPFGALRGTPGGPWPNDQGFVGGINDNTELTHLGAREYDPLLGRFISVDPVIDLADPQQMHGYAYANNNPVTASDPTGLLSTAECGPDGINCPGRADADPCAGGCNPTPGNGGGGPGGGGPGGGGPGGGGGDPCPPALVAPGCDDGEPELDDMIVHEVTGCEVFTGVDAATCRAAWAEQHFRDWVKGQEYLIYMQLLLDLCGLGPGYGEACDLLNAAIAYANSDNDGSAASLAAAIPGLGTGPALARATQLVKQYRQIKALSRCLGNSFHPDTPVLMADGTTKPIKDVKVGDKVLATDPATGDTSTQTVLAVHRNYDQELADLTVVTGDARTDTVHTTPHHLFWDHSAKQWVATAKLQRGDELRTVDDAAVTVAAVAPIQASAWMHDLTVADKHTYYVLAGTMSILVHNDDGFYVPDNWIIVRGGGGAMNFSPGEVFSGSMGATLDEAGAATGYGSLRFTTAGQIRAAGGIVDWAPEPVGGKANDPRINYRHVNITLGQSNPFGDIVANPIKPSTGRMSDAAIARTFC